MVILPAIDLKGGVCVRLRQGRADDVTTYSDDPAAQARDWRDQGGRELHVVDLDGAFAGTPRHAETIRAIIGSAPLEDPEFLTRAVEQYGERIAVGIDARDGFVQTRGWVKTTAVKAADLAKAVAAIGVKTIIYTDTATDGMLGGPNLVQMAAICDAAPSCRVTASGGVSSPTDVKNLLALGRPNLRAAIVGKALYDGRATLRVMNEAADGKV